MKIVSGKESSAAQIVTTMVEVIKKGGLVIFPTETTYGAGVDATNQKAVDKLLAYKTRREGKPLSIAVADRAMAEKYVEINDSAAKMYQTFLPGPFTIVSRSKHQTAVGVDSEFGTVGVRIPDYELILAVLRKLGRPITATSANASGKKRPYKIDDLLNNLSAKQQSLIDLIVDMGELPHNKPSTIIDTTLSTPVQLRQGDRSGEVEGVVDSQANLIELKSETEAETKAIAGRFMLKNWSELKRAGLIIGLDGELGVGKTIFAKGVAEFLQIKDTITSPTYSYMNEYDFERHGVEGKFYHLDAWKIDSEEELRRLGFFELAKPGNVVVVEWWEQIAGLVGEADSLTNVPVLQVKLQEVADEQRRIFIHEK